MKHSRRRRILVLYPTDEHDHPTERHFVVRGAIVEGAGERHPKGG